MTAFSDIQARKTGFYFRKAIPPEIRHQFGGNREIVRSLGKDAAKARVKGRELSLQVERLIVAARESGGAIQLPFAVPPSLVRKPKAAHDRIRAKARRLNPIRSLREKQS